jgi:hypothetical protein
LQNIEIIWTTWANDSEYYRQAKLQNFFTVDNKRFVKDSINGLTSGEMKRTDLHRKRDNHSGFAMHKLWSWGFLKEIKWKNFENLSIY